MGAKKKSGPAFVAGATGFTGREVVRFLVESGMRIIAHVRPDSSRLDDWKDRFSSLGAEVDTTPWDEQSMVRTISKLKPAYIFALLGTTRSRMKLVARAGGDPKDQSYEAVDYGLTAMLVRAGIATKSQPVFIYLSAAGAQGRNPSSYSKARRKAENAVASSGLPYIIARPSFIVGPDRDDARSGERIGAAAIDMALTLAGKLGARKIKERYSSTTNTILAESLVRLTLDPNSVNTIFESEELK